MVYGQKISRFSPRFYTLIFMICDFISLVLQAAGGALAATQDAGDSSRLGVNIMIAGLVFQVLSLSIFIAFSLEFAWRAHKARESDLNFDFFNIRKRTMFRVLPYAIAVATITIYIRCVFRVAELWDGFGGKLANDQTAFMILEGPMIIIATIALTVCHPGIAFGSAQSWAAANWTFRKSKKRDNNHMELVSPDTTTPSVAESEVIDTKSRV
jgi:hypothetical protein